MITLLQTSAGNASESGDDDKILYASVQSHKKNKDTKKPEEDEIQYASITVHQPATEAKWDIIISVFTFMTLCGLYLI